MQTPKTHKLPHRQKISAWLNTFFFAPASARPLATLRIGVAATLIVQALVLRDQFFELFASTGILQGPIARFLAGPQALDVHWFVTHGIRERAVLLTVGGAYLVSLAALLLGLFTRPFAVLAWLCHLLLMNTGYSANYGVDVFAHIFLFYFMFMPVSNVWSMDALRIPMPVVSSGARLALRVIQLQLCIAYFATAAEKAVGPQWWNGEVIWRALTLPVYVQYDMSWLAGYMWLAKLASWGTLVVEGLYCIFVWPRQTRTLWVVLTASMHIGIAVFLGLEIFGVFMLCLTASVFGVSAEPPEELGTVLVEERGGHAVASV